MNVTCPDCDATFTVHPSIYRTDDPTDTFDEDLYTETPRPRRREKSPGHLPGGRGRAR
jgi:hypothetical protein